MADNDKRDTYFQWRNPSSNDSATISEGEKLYKNPVIIPPPIESFSYNNGEETSSDEEHDNVEEDDALNGGEDSEEDDDDGEGDEEHDNVEEDDALNGSEDSEEEDDDDGDSDEEHDNVEEDDALNGSEDSEEDDDDGDEDEEEDYEKDEIRKHTVIPPKYNPPFFKKPSGFLSSGERHDVVTKPVYSDEDAFSAYHYDSDNPDFDSPHHPHHNTIDEDSLADDIGRKQYAISNEAIVENERQNSNLANKLKSSNKFNIDAYVLTAIALLLVSNNRNITPKIKIKTHQLIELIDPENYKNSPDLYWRVMLIKDLSYVIKEEKISNPAFIKYRLCENTDFRNVYLQGFYNILESNQEFYVNGYVLNKALDNTIIKTIDDYVSLCLDYEIVWNNSDSLIRQLTAIQSANVSNLRATLESVKTSIEVINRELKRNKKSNDFENKDFNLIDGSFEESISLTHDARSVPQNKIKTALKGLNLMLNGGFEGGRVYVLFARSGDWKSGLMLSCALWAIQNDINSYQPKDPTKIPTVLYVTQENSDFETIERMVSFYFGSTLDIQRYDKSDIVKSLSFSMSNGINFSFKFRPSLSISSEDLVTYIEEEEESGNEVVMLVHDYLKHIRPNTKSKERHIDLGNVILEFAGIASSKHIPILTGNQLKREAYDIIYTHLMKGDLDGLKKINQSHVSESINVYENADCVIFSARVRDENKQLYLTLQRSKFRGKRSGELEDVEYIAYPYVYNTVPNKKGEFTINEMRLEEDYNTDEFHGIECLTDVVKNITPYYDPNEECYGESDASRFKQQVPNKRIPLEERQMQNSNFTSTPNQKQMPQHQNSQPINVIDLHNESPF